jgi:hypothetical protein
VGYGLKPPERSRVACLANQSLEWLVEHHLFPLPEHDFSVGSKHTITLSYRFDLKKMRFPAIILQN